MATFSIPNWSLIGTRLACLSSSVEVRIRSGAFTSSIDKRIGAMFGTVIVGSIPGSSKLTNNASLRSVVEGSLTARDTLTGVTQVRMA